MRCLVHDQLDPVDHAAADHRPGERVARLHGAGRQARERRLGVVGVHGGQRAAVAGVEGLEQVGGLGAAHLAHDDVIGTVAQGVAHEVADRHVAAREAPRLEAHAVVAAEPQLQRVLDRDDAAPGRQQRHQRVQERRLAGAGAPRDQDVAAAPERRPRPLGHRRGERPARRQLPDREGAAPEAADRDRGARGGRGAADGDAGAVGEARVDDRRRRRVQPQGARDLESAARATTSAVSAGTARAAIRPARSTKTAPGPLIISSEIASSSSASSRPGRNGLRSAMPSSI